MKIGLIAAMNKELTLLLPLMSDTTTVEINGFTFHCGTIGRHSVTAMQCGIGKVNAAIGCMTLVDNFHPEAIINTGVAGGTGSAAHIMDIVVADAVAYHDVWCGPGTAPGEAAGCPHPLPTDPGLRSLPALRPLHHGLIASGDIFVDNAETVRRILALYPEALAIDMESAALAHTCYRRNIPFLCLRVISDTPGAVDDNTAQYENFWAEAPRRAFDTVKELIEQL